MLSLRWLYLALAYNGFAYGGHFHEAKPTRDVSEVPTWFNWTDVRAGPSLDYRPCYDGFECARLEVPLDWTNASNPNRVQLAIIRLPASVPETDPSFGGTILFNPGGPGGSGVDVMRWSGYGLRDVVDSDKHFEILTWDPRGMQHTTPKVSCFGDDLQRDVWTYRYDVLGPMDTTNTSLHQKWALGKGFGELCGQSQDGLFPDGSRMAQYATTALSVMDMVEIIDKVEERRTHLTAEHGSRTGQQSMEPKYPALLNYWGYSYGSFLGNTFASMYPSRVGRVILDGIVDSEDYTASGWTTNLLDFHKGMETFYEDCFAAGYHCRLNELNFSSPKSIGAAVDDLLERLKHDPLVAVHDGMPDLVTSGDLSSQIFASMYWPTWSWNELGTILADLLQNNTTSIIPYLSKVKIPAGNPDKDELGAQLLHGLNWTNPYPPMYPFEGEAGRAVICGDGDDITHLTVEDWAGRLSQWHAQSPIAGWRWGENLHLCAHWPSSFKPAERHRFVGPWTSKLSDYDPRAIPLLFIGGTSDPVLPLRNAYKAAWKHEGARVLIQNAPGHCSGYTNPSQCTWNYVKAFFAEGILPENGTVCERDGTAWTDR